MTYIYLLRKGFYIRTHGLCSEVFCETLTTVDQCNVGATALYLPGVSQSEHIGKRLPGCFVYKKDKVEFNSNLEDTKDWPDTDSICYCRGISIFADIVVNQNIRDELCYNQSTHNGCYLL